MSHSIATSVATESFNFDSFTVRAINRNGEIWFVAADVCAALEIQNVTQALQSLDDDEYSIFNIGKSERGNPNVNIINESGLYALILRSRKTEAKRFRKWVTSEVLPSIRKTGAYVHKAYKHGGSDKLSAEQADAIREALRNACEQLPKERQAAFMLRGWSKLRSHFKVGYRQIPAEEFTEAMSITARHIAGHLPLLPPPSVTIPRKQAEDLAKLSQKVCMLFHPLSEYFCYAIGICRLLRGRSANIGDRVEGYVDLLEGVKK